MPFNQHTPSTYRKIIMFDNSSIIIDPNIVCPVCLKAPSPEKPAGQVCEHCNSPDLPQKLFIDFAISLGFEKHMTRDGKEYIVYELSYTPHGIEAHYIPSSMFADAHEYELNNECKHQTKH